MAVLLAEIYVPRDMTRCVLDCGGKRIQVVLPPLRRFQRVLAFRRRLTGSRAIRRSKLVSSRRVGTLQDASAKFQLSQTWILRPLLRPIRSIGFLAETALLPFSTCEYVYQV